MKTHKYELVVTGIPKWFDKPEDFKRRPILEVPKALDGHIHHFQTLIALPQFRDENDVPLPTRVIFRAPLVEGFDPVQYEAFIEVGDRYSFYYIENRYDENQKIVYFKDDYYE
jgi:hypothetical protein